MNKVLLVGSLGSLFILSACATDGSTTAALREALDSVQRVADAITVELEQARQKLGGGDLTPTRDPLRGVEVETHLDRMIDESDTLIHIVIDGSHGWMAPWKNLKVLEDGVSEMGHHDLHNSTLQFNNTYGAAETTNGVSVAAAEYTHRPDAVKDLRRYAGWMDESFFLVAWWRTSDVTYRDAYTHLYSIGSASGANPLAGSAIWTGVMRGVDVSADDYSRHGNAVEGTAVLDIDDFTRPDIDLTLTGIHDLDLDESRVDLAWKNVPLSGGVFQVEGLSGRFYGSDHEEVGGVFLKNEIAGVFGARRE